MWKGIPFGNSGLSQTHLVFVDDCLLFQKATNNTITNLKEVFKTYQLVFGQKGSLSNSAIFFSKTVGEEE